ncbi:PH domain-containing protein [Marivirga harenae]|uniref:PH domain-containing protein n=1 Tax=Marivirga harenae TaxID=2010992 RepID=UPI0026E0189A|nr:PH domain-containing protein [Marivirga harenae]WKV11101.1 PH domain-containing protein [Marivirga harenae]|tara:strand:+ start:13926 stop:14303 length:378 start_codon:yes stop_codon:yes gene_type:complete
MNFFSNFLNSSGVLENSKIMENYGHLFLDEEQIEVGFKLNNDTFVFTNKRLIFIGKQVMESTDISTLSIPFTQISFFSLVTSKNLDPKAILKIWLIGQQEPILEKEFNKSVDVYEVQKILAGHVL